MPGLSIASLISNFLVGKSGLLYENIDRACGWCVGDLWWIA